MVLKINSMARPVTRGRPEAGSNNTPRLLRRVSAEAQADPDRSGLRGQGGQRGGCTSSISRSRLFAAPCILLVAQDNKVEILFVSFLQLPMFVRIDLISFFLEWTDFLTPLLVLFF
jgi:hypothetical protein